MTSTFNALTRRAREIEQEAPETCKLRVTASPSLLVRLLDEFEEGGGEVFRIGNAQFLFGHVLVRLDAALPIDCFKIELQK